jgi:putative tricarboxylic transport membrane protein
MKLHPALAGLLVLIFGLAIVAHARTFPAMPGQSVGPAFFPTIVGAGLILCAIALIVSGRASGAPWIQAGDWVRRPRMLFNLLLVFLDLVFYAFAVARLGFVITAVIFLGVVMLAFGVPKARILPVALVVTLVIHYAFYTLLRVPLPWGVLESVAW